MLDEGIKVLRFKNYGVKNNIEMVLVTIGKYSPKEDN
jgi:very-short-patch-repair endonuclease